MKKYIQKHMYKWHRIVGLIVLIPTILWTFSGMMHPFMSHWFKTEIPNDFYQEEKLEVAKNSIQLKTLLEQNKIYKFKNVRLVNYQSRNYFQVKFVDNSIHYFDTKNGKELINGEKKYAESIARYMLDDQESKVSSIELINNFTPQYKYVNRLLPVWKVSFERDDHMDIYVETAHSKFATFNDDKRKVFIWIFSNFHNWAFLDVFKNNTLHVFVMIFFIGVIFFSAISGIVIYCFHWKFFKKPEAGDKLGLLRRCHRIMGITFSLISFLFAFSGGYHLLQKLTPDDRMSFLNEPVFKTNELPDKLKSLNKNELNFSFVKMKDTSLFLTQSFDFNSKSIIYNYYDLKTNKQIDNGNEKYCNYLVENFSNKKGEKLVSNKKEWITDFTNEYGFVNKRLPVMAFHLQNEKSSSYYIDPFTGHLAAYIQKSNRLEGFSFAFLHKFHFLDSYGKNFRDGILVFLAFSIFVVSLLGVLIFLKKR